MSTATKVPIFQQHCLRNPEPVIEHVRHLLARGARPHDLADRWNNAEPEFLLDAKLGRDKAIAIMVDHAYHLFQDRDGTITPDVAKFIRRLNDRARTSKQSLKRILTDVEKRTAAMLAVPPAWPFESERRAAKQLRKIRSETSETGIRRQTYPGTSTGTYYVP